MNQTNSMPAVDMGDGDAVFMRRLGPADLGHIARITRASANEYAKEDAYLLRSLGASDALSSFLFLGLPTIEEKATPWLASLVGIPEADCRDPEKFPLSVLTQVLEGLTIHPDLVYFVETIQRIAASSLMAPFARKIKEGLN